MAATCTPRPCRFLTRAGYEVRHFYARYPDWGIGKVSEPLAASEAIEFDAAGWNVAEIQAQYRSAVDSFRPDYVAITDTWNMKPLLAEAMRGYPCLLLYQARRTSARSITSGCWPTEPNKSASARGTSLPRPRFAIVVLLSTAITRERSTSASGPCGVGTPEYDQKLQSRCKRPRPC